MKTICRYVLLLILCLNFYGISFCQTIGYKSKLENIVGDYKAYFTVVSNAYPLIGVKITEYTNISNNAICESHVTFDMENNRCKPEFGDIYDSNGTFQVRVPYTMEWQRVSRSHTNEVVYYILQHP